EYQTQNRNRVRAQVAAIYEALRSEGIVYSIPPASFEKTGQRVRTADKVLTEKVATCLDTSLLMASCLEDAGIYPVLLIFKGHATVGAWLTPTVPAQMVGDDPNYLLREIADGNNNLVVMESTAIAMSEYYPFESTVETAMKKLRNESEFCCFIDVHRCRLGGIKPIPQRVMKDGAWVVVNEGIDHTNDTAEINNLNHYDLRLDSTGEPTTKQMIWERKLLDFSLRNNLLNTKLGKRVVPFISFGIEHLEDKLQNGEDYTITPSPGKKIDPNDDGMFDSEQQATEHREYVSEIIGKNKIASYLTEAELQNALKFVYRTARTALEENGANSLFLALGLLKWYENGKSEQPRYAPILLLPVDIIRKSGNNYIIRKRDEDTILNITLVELLKQNFKINLDALKVLPKDESGVDVKKIFTYFRRAIEQQNRWNVIEESMLGIFSFNKFVMWNDIHTNAEEMRKNLIVASLIEKSDQQEPPTDATDAREIDKNTPPDAFAIPLDVDSSQMEAIVESGKGRTFILHGPPGTGKSQTITNMIANSLYQGKRVLFVAEKMAALTVVQSRLDKVGLSPFCLELHSNKATKKHFLSQMEEVLNITKIKSPEQYAARAAELFEERKALSRYMEVLHKTLPCGLSLYDAISAYLGIEGDEIGEALPDISAINADYINRCQGQVDQINAVLDISGIPQDNALFGLEPVDNRQETLDAILAILSEFNATLTEFNSRRSAFRDSTGIGIQYESDCTWLKMLIEHLLTEKKRDELLVKISSTYSAEFANIDMKAFRREWDGIKAKWFLPRYFAKKKFINSLQRFGAIFESGIDDAFNLVDEYQTAGNALPVQVENMVAFAQQNNFSHQDRFNAYLRFVGAAKEANRQIFVNDASAIVNLNDRLSALVGDLNSRTNPANTKANIIVNVAKWIASFDKMRDWYHWADKKRELLSLSLAPSVALIEKGVAPDKAIDSFLKGVYHSLIVKSIDVDESLRMFNGVKFRQIISQYKQHTKNFQELSKQELYSKLASRVPTSSAAPAGGTEISNLKRNIASGGRGNSIRSIIDSIPTLFPRLCPCMLMSPISVAQYIDITSEKFDLVIFDEASQIPTSEAVGAIARGNALIVVGDSKQMPPTNFFTTSNVDEEEADIDDMESILDDCITLSLCEHQLKWHYRSKHESLIAFSNSQYYGNQLFTFPSTDDRVAKVRLVPIDGVYDKGHTRSNRDESKAIVKEILRRLEDPELRKLSIGVVAFSKVQGDLIEDDLTDELDRRPDLKDIAYNDNEPIFIKNLENVQGDERDVILFSVGYGADKYGKVSMNFGPLNNAGGERRLNVAVSRARYEMIVYSTLRASQIDLKRSQAKGVVGLKCFLEYAETGKLPAVSDITATTDKNVIIDQICNVLKQHGYIATPNVGRSNFKVDIAVSTPDNPDRYILGLLCDGKTYRDTKTTRDREIVQPGVLESLKWQIMRVYSVDFYQDRDRFIEQVLAELEAAKNGVKTEPAPAEDADKFVFDIEKVKSATPAETVVPNRHCLPYVESNAKVRKIDSREFDPLSMANQKIIYDIVTAEQPITFEYLCRRMAKVIGFSRAGSNVQSSVSMFVNRLYREPFARDIEATYWFARENSVNYSSYRSPSERNIADIPLVELANVVKEVLEEEFSVNRENLPTIVARKLGFASTGAKINERVLLAVDLMAKRSIVTITDNYVKLTEA
ncbi:MAG: DUF4011 domain-containing protein, partial [Muribaculaceae bacterium]|nr:DUF4011 domain-containing protein [Muribaculaceae bacterium]